ncbi:MAG: ATP-binding cassette domain-containing protein, partial [Deltaproteobacteria bacterium]|nr:ATP-binding cassette domain-containing protein [Deltaproteobacteria bacterium]
MDSASILEVENLAIKIDDVELISNVSFKLESGKTMALVGESGCGKSITALSILQLLPEVARISKGSICLNSRELSDLSEREMRAVRGNEISM